VSARDGAAGGADRKEPRCGRSAAEELAQVSHPDLGGKGAARDDAEHLEHVNLRYAVDFAASCAGGLPAAEAGANLDGRPSCRDALFAA
jgi:hypothetical protein